MASKTILTENLADSEYCAGAKFGWNCGVENDHARFQQMMDGRERGREDWREEIKAARREDATETLLREERAEVVRIETDFRKLIDARDSDIAALRIELDEARRRLGLSETVCGDIQMIMKTYRDQEAEGSVDTPGGLEHMGDVWRQLAEWDETLRASA